METRSERREGKINAASCSEEAGRRRFFLVPCAAAGRRVCRPLPVLSPNVAIFFNDVAPPRPAGRGLLYLLSNGGEWGGSKGPAARATLSTVRRTYPSRDSALLVPPQLLAFRFEDGNGSGNGGVTKRRKRRWFHGLRSDVLELRMESDRVRKFRNLSS